MSNDWKQDPKLSNIDSNKLDMLQMLAEQGKGKNISDMLPFLMSAAAQGKKSGLNFSPAERQIILDSLKKGKSPEETAKLDRIISLMGMIR